MMINRHFATLGKGLSLMILAGAIVLPIHAQPTSTLSNRSIGVIKLWVLDKSTRRPIANRSTQIYSDNGVRCVTTPCPTNSKNWQGKTNSQGIVFIPKQLIQASTTLMLKGYMAADLVRAFQQRPSGRVLIRLVPSP